MENSPTYAYRGRYPTARGIKGVSCDVIRHELTQVKTVDELPRPDDIVDALKPHLELLFGVAEKFSGLKLAGPLIEEKTPTGEILACYRRDPQGRIVARAFQPNQQNLVPDYRWALIDYTKDPRGRAMIQEQAKSMEECVIMMSGELVRQGYLLVP